MGKWCGVGRGEATLFSSASERAVRRMQRSMQECDKPKERVDGEDCTALPSERLKTNAKLVLLTTVSDEGVCGYQMGFWIFSLLRLKKTHLISGGYWKGYKGFN
ncbi:hypothetical protein AXG93_1275s1270 [Marchantia polymorpha subsp. ruderalis]|uniref:Uncharacterized protein n=1 Tax=Marchantia polymorpha subsp. ruderalis TaxID=1480154 RepID=A0A176VPF3_MARPO|nr:hypothetical protein AXG93_1275s1270 [Marchantia polymorpha subsp. ruderalis]